MAQIYQTRDERREQLTLSRDLHIERAEGLLQVWPGDRPGDGASRAPQATAHATLALAIQAKLDRLP